MSKEGFKVFVKNNPQLINYVHNNEMTWQSFYEMYDLYGESSDVWNEYLHNDMNESTKEPLVNNLKGLFELFKGVDLKSVQKTLNGLDKAIGTFRDFNSGNSNNSSSSYEPRPTNRYFED